ncbi:MAG: capsule assembly Wzi family protein [Imperialibacter sp.]|uniref:capsule assembly Wzi family protein n=1 Tax=Imperialibacter sp. TaxID=2038411 RepID=UPI0032EE2B04
MNKGKTCLFSLFILFSSSLFGQVLQPGTLDFEYHRLLLLKNDFDKEAIGTFPSIITDFAPDSSLSWNPWNNYLVPSTSSDKFSVVDPTFGTLYNSTAPRSYNDGAVWNGKGLNSWFTTGVMGKLPTGENGYFSYTLSPIVHYSQNAAIDIPQPIYNKSQYSYPFYERLDQVERYGDESLFKIDPGQSEVKYVYRGVAAGFTTQNEVWGPATFNPILMSQQAAGIPRFNLGFNRPIDTKIGRLEGKAFWGMLKESDYYDSNPNNNYRYITGFTGGYAPSFVKGLNLGLHRVMYRLWERSSMGAKDVFAAFAHTSRQYDTPLNGIITNDEYDQMASATIRWNRPELGLEIYTEYARNDFPGNFKEFGRNPDRSSAFVLGITEAFELSNGNTIKLHYENTKLSANQLQIVSIFSSPTYYVHYSIAHGYTQNGQIIGAGIGPGSNTNVLQAQYFTPKSMFGLTAQAIRFNDDYILREYAGALKYPSEFEFAYSAKYYRLFDQFTVEAQLQYAKHYHRYFVDGISDRNFQALLNLRYRINN